MICRLATSVLALVFITFTANAATPEEIAAMDAAALHKLDPIELCAAWHALKPANVRDELTRRRGFTRRVWWLIGRDFPDQSVGMNYVHVVCMWGLPAKDKRDVTTGGIKRMLTYYMDDRVYRVYLLNEAVQAYTESDD